MTSSKPYLVRAFYEWIVDNHLTPYLVLNAEMPEVHVPMQYVEAGKIVLNIAPLAVQNLHISNEIIEFGARFNGVATKVYSPIAAIVAIYAHENGRGIVFNEDEEGGGDDDDGASTPSTPTNKGRKPNLTLVK